MSDIHKDVYTHTPDNEWRVWRLCSVCKNNHTLASGWAETGPEAEAAAEEAFQKYSQEPPAMNRHPMDTRAMNNGTFINAQSALPLLAKLEHLAAHQPLDAEVVQNLNHAFMLGHQLTEAWGPYWESPSDLESARDLLRGALMHISKMNHLSTL